MVWVWRVEGLNGMNNGWRMTYFRNEKSLFVSLFSLFSKRILIKSDTLEYCYILYFTGRGIV